MEKAKKPFTDNSITELRESSNTKTNKDPSFYLQNLRRTEATKTESECPTCRKLFTGIFFFQCGEFKDEREDMMFDERLLRTRSTKEMSWGRVKSCWLFVLELKLTCLLIKLEHNDGINFEIFLVASE
ncbi:hypothetical protein ES319_D07G016900v1 [Gossypium barbadense]|uniref:Uncharacterized protein n=1 Tax=Gossypium barbadense TaxID=3634 RepID=A0A5J5QMJ6_GOSBA|nr:hypothetical protein ES319_D07G016900v1 [Gossypium barbadense]